VSETAHSELTFADRLRAARNVFGHTQMDACIEIGVAISTLATWEHAGIKPLGLQRAAALRYINKAQQLAPGQASATSQ